MWVPKVERTVIDRTAGSHASGRGSHPTACPSASRQTGTLPSSATSTRERTVRAVRHSDWVKKKSNAANPVVSSPKPRPKFPSRLCTGATEVTVVIADHAMYTSTTQPRTRARRSGADGVRTGFCRAFATHASPVSATRIGNAHAFGSS